MDYEREINYHRNGNSNFMIIGSKVDVPEVEEHMLSSNRLPMLLDFSVCDMDGQIMLWHDITAKRSIKALMEQDTPAGCVVASFLKGLITSCEKLSDFLIAPDHVFISPESLYVSARDTNEVFLCYDPGNEIPLRQQLLSFFEYMMTVSSKVDSELAECIYDIYGALSDEGFSFGEIKRRIPVIEQKDKVMEASEDRQQEPLSFAGGGNNTEFDISDRRHDEYDMAMQSVSGREVMIDEVFEEDEPGGFIAGIKNRLHLMADGIKDFFGDKKEEYFPPKDLQEDLIFDPAQHLPPPTRLPSPQMNSCGCTGRLIYEGDRQEEDFEIGSKSFFLGSRDRSNDGLLHSTAVSRRHARIFRSQDGFMIEDLGSTNGTYINGNPLSAGENYPLHYMDRILFADVPYRIV